MVACQTKMPMGDLKSTAGCLLYQGIGVPVINTWFETGTTGENHYWYL